MQDLVGATQGDRPWLEADRVRPQNRGDERELEIDAGRSAAVGVGGSRLCPPFQRLESKVIREYKDRGGRTWRLEEREEGVIPHLREGRVTGPQK